MNVDWSLASSIITAVITVAGFAVLFISLGRWGQRLDQRISGVETKVDKLATWAEGFSKEINSFFGVVIQLLNNRQQLSTEELGLVTKGLSDLNTPAISGLFEHERVSRNPLTDNELQRLEGYHDRLRAGQMISFEEAQDFNRLVAVLEKEHAGHAGIWPLAALGAFLRGFYMGKSPNASTTTTTP